MIDRRHLEYFLAVAERGSISAAAKQRNVSQPSVSEAMQRLEDALGAELFYRDSRGARLTEAGQALLGPASQVVRDFAVVDSILEPLQQLRRGSLTIACPRTLARDPVTPLVGRFRSTYPGVTISVVRPAPREVAADAIASGRAEVGFGVLPSERAEVGAELHARQEVMVIAAPSAGLRSAPTLDEVLAIGLVSPPRGGVTRQLVERIVGADRFDRAVVLETSYQGAIIPSVQAGLGAAFVPEGFSDEARSAGLDVLRPRPGLGRDVYLLRRRALSPAAEAFWAMAHDESSVTHVP